jgi:hypothetical protein
MTDGTPVEGMTVALDARITRVGELREELQWNARSDQDGLVRFERVPLPVEGLDAMDLTIAMRIAGSPAKPLPVDPTATIDEIIPLKAPPFGSLEVRFRGTAPIRRDLRLPLPVVPIVRVEPAGTAGPSMDCNSALDLLPLNEHPDVAAYRGTAQIPFVAAGIPLAVSVMAIDGSTTCRTIRLQHEGIRSAGQSALLTLAYDDFLPRD